MPIRVIDRPHRVAEHARVDVDLVVAATLVGRVAEEVQRAELGRVDELQAEGLVPPAPVMK